jgi:hypothetical protein
MRINGRDCPQFWPHDGLGPTANETLGTVAAEHMIAEADCDTPSPFDDEIAKLEAEIDRLLQLRREELTKRASRPRKANRPAPSSRLRIVGAKRSKKG